MRTEAQKKAFREYRRKLKKFTIAFHFCDIDLYNKMQERAKEEDITASTWIKNLIKKELEE